MPTPPKPPEQPVAIIRCTVCDKTVKVMQTDLDRYLRTQEWPKCCGEVMTLFLPASAPGQ